MVDSALNEVVVIKGPREFKSARTADLFTLLGTDWRKNIHTIVTQSLDIFEAEIALYLPAAPKEAPSAAGYELPDDSLSRLSSWTEEILALPAEDGIVILERNSLPKGLDLGCRLMACVPVILDQNPLGILVVGFEAAREFGPDDHHAARCLAGALSLQHRLADHEQKAATGAIARQFAHDLNNILSGLVSYPELVLMQMDDGDALRGPVSLMHDSGLQVADMVQDFLILARPSKQHKFYSVSPSVSARAYCQTASYTALTKLFPQARFSFFIEPDLPDIWGNDEFIPKVLTTLLHHSAQNLTGPGQVTVTLKESLPQSAGPPDLSERRGVQLTIEDKGPKTDETDLAHLFDPFYTKKAMGRRGSGLGLPAVKKLIQDQGGAISVSSGSRQGTWFDIFLPALS